MGNVPRFVKSNKMGTMGICNVCCDFIYLVIFNDEIIASSENRAFAAEVVGPSRVESIYIKHRFMQIDIICWCASENDFGGITTS